MFIIKINSKLFEKLLTITVDNSFNGVFKRDGDVFLSSKREGTGIGLSSVRAVVEKHSGMCKFEVQDNVFMASVCVKVGKVVTV